MYSHRTGLTLGFHGCDQAVAEAVISGQASLHTSDNCYDWLGHGIYFWDYSPKRALDFATFLAANPRGKKTIKNPAVLGAVIDLGFCLDLLDFENLEIVSNGYDTLIQVCKTSQLEIPQNRNASGNSDLLLRDLDCAVIETLHKIRQDSHLKPFDSVRGVFFEGESLYPNSGFRKKDHIQICIRNPNCIKGFFWSQESNNKFGSVSVPEKR